MSRQSLLLSRASGRCEKAPGDGDRPGREMTLGWGVILAGSRFSPGVKRAGLRQGLGWV